MNYLEALDNSKTGRIRMKSWDNPNFFVYFNEELKIWSSSNLHYYSHTDADLWSDDWMPYDPSKTIEEPAASISTTIYMGPDKYTYIIKNITSVSELSKVGLKYYFYIGGNILKFDTKEEAVAERKKVVNLVTEAHK